jgi:hypothetical protein
MSFTLVTGGYLGGGSAGYWSPYGYPLLLPPSLSHYQHYHNQLLLLQQAALLTPAHASASQVLRRPITRGRQRSRPMEGVPRWPMSQDTSVLCVYVLYMCTVCNLYTMFRYLCTGLHPAI